MKPFTHQQGAVLGAVLAGALVFSLTAYLVLWIALSRAQSVDFHERRLRALHAAEAGMVWAMAKLWADSTWSSPAGWSGPPNDPPPLDTDDNGTAETRVDIELAACASPPPPCELQDRTLKTKVVF